jgi:endo-1,4-beta-xylanase
LHRRSFIQLSSAALAGAACPRALIAESETPLREVAAQKRLLVGTAVSNAQLQRPEFTALLAEQCSILVSENDMKWRATQPEKDRFEFARADAFMEFADAHQISARGHNLCWHEYNPDWLEATATKENADALLKTHIQTVVARYRGRVHSWDVVNEAIKPADKNHHDMVNSVWLKTLGEDYLAIAFRAAAEADPGALLTYNDYDLERDTNEQEKKREAVLALLRRLRKKGVPLHAIGIQSHLHANSNPGTWNGLNKFLREIERLNLQAYLTELDVDDRELPSDISERDRLVAELYRNLLDNALRHNCVKAVLTWGFSDRGTWLNGFHPRKDQAPQRPLPYDADLHPKPAFYSIRDSIVARP